MKKVLGLDLGTTSIGWAMTENAQSASEKSSILGIGVRVNPLTVDEKGNFEKGKSCATNSGRTTARGMRRNLQRYKLRRDNLIQILKREGWIDDSTLLCESKPSSTFETYRLRALSASSEISLPELARVLLMINKKRGYKSNRKAKNNEEGQLIDGMSVARVLYDEGITPGQYSYRLLSQGKKHLPDYYRSDLENELDKVWAFQKRYYPDILADDFYSQLYRQGRNGTSKIFLARYGIYTAENKSKDKNLVATRWRSKALDEQLSKEELAYVIADLRNQIDNSSGYLGKISDRSKNLFFNHQTVGQYLYSKLSVDPNYSVRNQVFYRQDYLDEFESVWECQKKYHRELNDELKSEIRDVVIFYQRNLKSQKGLVSYCEFESKPIKLVIDGKERIKIRGCKVAPKSSLLFQEYKIWNVLNNLVVQSDDLQTTFPLEIEKKDKLASQLKITAKLSASEALKLIGLSQKKYKLNYKELEGNTTIMALYSKFLDIVNMTGHGPYELKKMTYEEVHTVISQVFSALGFKTDYLDFDSDLPKQQYEQQPLFKLWHLLYSYEGDNSNTGDKALIKRISELCGIPEEYAKVIASVTFQDDYASLSHKAISKILPFLKEGHVYSEACALAGYNHSYSETKDDLRNKEYKERLELLPKGSLRNPVVEKIVNQMVNVINAAADTYGKPDEIHIEMARELKMTAAQREQMTKDISDRNNQNKDIEDLLKSKFHLTYVSKNDILRYRLYDELKSNGYKTLYSNRPISPDLLFSDQIDIEHILPQALFFDDSYSNKTLEFKDVNIKKGKTTANDFVLETYGEECYEQYVLRVKDLYSSGAIKKAKYENLLMKRSEIPADHLNRDLPMTQYIARKARELLLDYVKVVLPTTGEITSRLREDWQLVDIMKELDMPKYEKAGLTYTVERDGKIVRKIKDWTKRNDHRHHAMDALTVAFTEPVHIQILNNLSACSAKDPRFVALENSARITVGTKRVFIPPMPLGQLRGEFKKALESTLVSVKAKNKVATRNINRIKTVSGFIEKAELTPRGQLHKENVYGIRKQYETFYITVNGSITREDIELVASEKQRLALLRRLEEFDCDSKRAFTGKNSLKVKPIYLDEIQSQELPSKVKCVRFVPVFTIRKIVDPNLTIDKIVDGKAKSLILQRIARFNGDVKNALSNLDDNPIWMDDAHTKSLKCVTIAENIQGCPIRYKRDRHGSIIRDNKGNPIPNDYVNLKNNHHVALYVDDCGVVHECLVTFMEALRRKSIGQPIVDRCFNEERGWKFLYSIKINEMFVFPNKDFNPHEIDLKDLNNYEMISPNLFRVQNVSSKYYNFTHHLETVLGDNPNLRDITWKRITKIQAMKDVVKVRIDHLGHIVDVGEYD